MRITSAACGAPHALLITVVKILLATDVKLETTAAVY